MIDPAKDMIRIFLIGISEGGTDEARNAFMEMAGASLVD
jgi:hypothetical protein